LAGLDDARGDVPAADWGPSHHRDLYRRLYRRPRFRAVVFPRDLARIQSARYGGACSRLRDEISSCGRPIEHSGDGGCIRNRYGKEGLSADAQDERLSFRSVSAVRVFCVYCPRRRHQEDRPGPDNLWPTLFRLFCGLRVCARMVDVPGTPLTGRAAHEQVLYRDLRLSDERARLRKSDRHAFEPGYAQVGTPEEAELVLYNTCSIRDKAEQKVFHRL